MRKTIRTIFTWALAVILAPIVGEFFVKLAAQASLYDDPARSLMAAIEFFTNSAIFWAGFFFIAGATFILWLIEYIPKPEQTCEEAYIELHNYDESRPPRRVSNGNVDNHFLLVSHYDVIKKGGEISKQFMNTIVFLVFHPKLKEAGSITVTSDDFKIPSYEVYSFNDRSAIIIFEGRLPTGDFKVHATSKSN